MNTSRRFVTVGLALALGGLLSACAGGGNGEGAAHAGGHEDGEASVEAAVTGQPASAEDADRVITVETLDSLAFDPETIEVAAGETVTFVVTNPGKATHEFVLGNEAYQEEHGAEMGEGEHGEGAVEVEPGETKRLTWTFDEAGETLIGCHEPGHYEGGMVGTIEIS